MYFYSSQFKNIMSARINLSDAIFMVMGSMIGSGIFIVSADMSRTLGGGGWLLVAWIITGILSVLGALCFGELAAMMPKSGGQYHYLKECYNNLIGFLYGWTLFLVIQTGTMAAVAVAFAKFTSIIFPVFSPENVLLDLGYLKINAAQILAIASLILLSFLNTRGLSYGKLIQSIFTSTKVFALIGIIVCGIFIFRDDATLQSNLSHFWDSFTTYKDGKTSENLLGLALLSGIGGAMVGSLFSADAWNYITFIAGDMNNPKRNIPLSMIIGVSSVCAIYFLANVAYLCVLPILGDPNALDVYHRGIMFATQDRVGTAAALQMFGSIGAIIMAILIMISTFGCNNGLIISGARVYQTMAKDGLFFLALRKTNKFNVPFIAIWVQCFWTIILCLSGKYGDLLDYVMFAVMIFYIITVIGLLILRVKKPNADRPYKVALIIPILYLFLTISFTLNLLITKPQFTIPGLVIVLLGVPVFYIFRKIL